MRLYRTTYIDDEQPDGHELQEKWDGTQADARTRRNQLKAEFMRSIETKEVDVPTDKAGLIAFLNGSEP